MNYYLGVYAGDLLVGVLVGSYYDENMELSPPGVFRAKDWPPGPAKLRQDQAEEGVEILSKRWPHLRFKIVQRSYVPVGFA